MAAIWRDIVIDWQGSTYTVRPTMAIINAVQQVQGGGIHSQIERMAQRDISSAVMAHVIAVVLSASGRPSTAEEVYLSSSACVSAEAVVAYHRIIDAIALFDDAPAPVTASDDAKKKP